jgi:hypothetical protein
VKWAVFQNSLSIKTRLLVLIGNMISRKVATVLLHYYGSPSSPHAISILEFIIEDLMNDRIGDSRNSVDSNIVECWVVWSSIDLLGGRLPM